MTRDVDFVIDLEEAQVDEFVELLEAEKLSVVDLLNEVRSEDV